MDYGIIGKAPDIYDVSDDVAEKFGAIERILGMLVYMQIGRETSGIEPWVKDRI